MFLEKDKDISILIIILIVTWVIVSFIIDNQNMEKGDKNEKF